MSKTLESDNGYTSEVSGNNKIEIGLPIYTQVTTSNTLPAVVNYHVTDCTAWELIKDESGVKTGDSTGKSYSIIKVSFNFKYEFIMALKCIQYLIQN